MDNKKKFFAKTELKASALDTPALKLLENNLFMEECKIDFTIYRRDCKKFDELWVKAYALIRDS